MSFQNGVVFQTLLRPVRWWRNRFLTDLTCRTTRSVEQHSDGVKSFCWVSIQCMHYLGATAQLPEWACQWTLVWARLEHFLMALHSGMAIGMQYHFPIGYPVRQTLTKAIVQASINSLECIQKLPADASATVHSANSMKWSSLAQTPVVLRKCWLQCPLTTCVIIAAITKLTAFRRHYESTTGDQVHQKIRTSLRPWCDTSGQSAQLWNEQSPGCRTNSGSGSV